MSCFVNSLLNFHRSVNKIQQVEAGEDFIFLIHLFFLLLIFSFFFTESSAGQNLEAPAQENVDEQIDAEKEKIIEDEKTGASEADKRVMNIIKFSTSDNAFRVL